MVTQRDWISPDEAAKILSVSRSTVSRSLQDTDRANELWGAGNWRRKPLSNRGDHQVRRARALELAAQTEPLKGAAAEPDEPGEVGQAKEP